MPKFYGEIIVFRCIYCLLFYTNRVVVKYYIGERHKKQQRSSICKKRYQFWYWRFFYKYI